MTSTSLKKKKHGNGNEFTQHHHVDHTGNF